MTQMNFGLDTLPKKTWKEDFLDEMNQVVPWDKLVKLIPCLRHTLATGTRSPPRPGSP